MAEQKLQKLSRKELLELMISQGEALEKAHSQLDEANRKLAERELAIKDAGSIAEAALALSRVFEDADTAAQIYLDSIKKMAQEQEEALARVKAKEQELDAALEKLGSGEALPSPQSEGSGTDE
jgi:glutathione S-transferase